MAQPKPIVTFRFTRLDGMRTVLGQFKACVVECSGVFDAVATEGDVDPGGVVKI